VTAVRFGRVPKREKAKILEQMQRVNVQCQGSLVDSIVADEVPTQRIATARINVIGLVCCDWAV